MSHMEFSLVDKVFSAEPIAIFFFKILQCPGAYCKVIGSPVRKEAAVLLTVPPYPGKVIKHGSETHYRGIRVLPAPVVHPCIQILPGFLRSGVYRHQMFLLPVVSHMVIHGDFFPDPVSEKGTASWITTFPASFSSIQRPPGSFSSVVLS